MTVAITQKASGTIISRRLLFYFFNTFFHICMTICIAQGNKGCQSVNTLLRLYCLASAEDLCKYYLHKYLSITDVVTLRLYILPLKLDTISYFHTGITSIEIASLIIEF